MAAEHQLLHTDCCSADAATVIQLNNASASSLGEEFFAFLVFCLVPLPHSPTQFALLQGLGRILVRDDSPSSVWTAQLSTQICPPIEVLLTAFVMPGHSRDSLTS